jgi:alkylation response protein AidB-like acyl-CoA dehydrogenase
VTLRQLSWHRLAPWPVLDEEPLWKIARYLAQPEVESELHSLDEAGEYPHAIRQELHRLGLSKVFTGRGSQLGGPNFVQMSALAALTAYMNGSLAITVSVNGLALLPLYHEASDEQLQRAFDRVESGAYCALLLTERQHGSNLLANQTSAHAVANLVARYEVKGEKHLINGGTHHELLMTFVRTAQGAAKLGFAARNDFSLLMIERDATVEALPKWQTLPAPAADISGVRFRGTLVPAINRIGEEGSGFSLIQKTLMISRGGISALASGCASRATALAMSYAGKRNIYGEPINRLGVIAEGLLKMKGLDLIIASMSLKAVAMTNARGVSAAHYTSAAKYACCFLAEETVNEGRVIHGGAALLAEQPYQSLVRDVLLYGIFDGTSHLMLDQLQWRLAQAAALGPSSVSPLAQMRGFFSQMPNNLIQVLRERHATVLFSTVDYLRELDALGGDLSLQPLIVICEELFAFTRECRQLKLWDGDQALRFAAGHAFALVESLIALVEFCDAPCRLALGMPAIPEKLADLPLLSRFSFNWLGLRSVAAVRAIRAQAGMSAATQVENAEALFAPCFAAARRELLALNPQSLTSIP